jgi:3-methyladenine DNA glycosylase AlkD
MRDYLVPLVGVFEAHADVENAGPMKRYMRDQFEFLGIKTPQRRSLVRAFYDEYGLPPVEELAALVLELWQMPYREYQYTAVGFLERRQRTLTPKHIALLEQLITTKSWWDTVDGLAANQVGGVLARFPEARDGAIGRWRRAENIWLRRTTLLFQLRYKEKTDSELLYALIRENLDDREFFIQKAIGWALREYSKSDPAAVQQFVAETALSGLAQREALKWMKNKGMIA